MNELISRGISEVITEAELTRALKGKKMRLKLGVDPTSPDIHLGHAVVLRKLRQFQDQGHTVIFLIGDATARVGDPSGINKTRPVLSDKEIEANAKTYLAQVGKILDLKKAEIRRNSEWLDKLDLAKLLELAGKFTVAQIIERDDFKTRLKQGVEISLHEILYPLMQAYDSVCLEADVEFGGTDQRFNMLAARNLQKKLGQRPQQIVMCPLLVGTDGVQKMSKSFGNYIGITDTPADMYGKVMSLPDALVGSYYELCTDVPMNVIKQVIADIAAGANPRDTKASLAREIVRQYHGEKEAAGAEEGFNKQFRDKQAPEDITEEKITKAAWDPAELLVGLGLASSKSEARRLISQKGVKIAGQTIDADNVKVGDGDIVQVGKRRFVKLHLS
ncbi:MAG TPA: tyrosine--tRNA ligase [Candidatus Dormibacteraeota bacterium]|nr:tyrosine--tRNA ligase [Candidatus Dormibacteraeota bacterium]